MQVSSGGHRSAVEQIFQDASCAAGATPATAGVGTAPVCAGPATLGLAAAALPSGETGGTGFGGSTPLINPDTKGAAMINDRIELIILERN